MSRKFLLSHIYLFILLVIVNTSSVAMDRSSIIQKIYGYTQKFDNYIEETIESDFGFKINPNSQPKTSSDWLLSGLATGARLSAYSFISSLLAALALKPFIDASSLPPQFEPNTTPQKAFAISAILIAPIVEEFVFTYCINKTANRIFPKSGQIVSPILFGLAHSHNNYQRFLFNAALTSPVNFIHSRYFNAHHNLFPCIVSHSLKNALAVSLLLKKGLI